MGDIFCLECKLVYFVTNSLNFIPYGSIEYMLYFQRQCIFVVVNVYIMRYWFRDEMILRFFEWFMILFILLRDLKSTSTLLAQRKPVECPHKGRVVSMNKLLNKQLSYLWLMATWRSGDVAIISICSHVISDLMYFKIQVLPDNIRLKQNLTAAYYELCK